ncbi:TM2 domain-containing protein [Coprothermobacter proteolyticus]|uniref:TM2 domain-containing protein n=1 Tax=Coprothermobacter proteolyticus TaxID=35786 RepID=UPI000D304269|nr:TM2 domain-containing protein [Coprothermobacter proteolyticus]
MSLEDKSKLTEKQLVVLESEMQKHKKSVGVAYLLWFFFGSLGIHKFYLGNAKRGLLYLILGIFGWASIIFGGGFALFNLSYGSSAGAGGFFAITGMICMLVLGIMLLIDLFTIPSQIQKSYQDAENEIISHLLSMSESEEHSSQ